MNLENIMRVDYEEAITKGTQTALIAIGVVSTFFRLKPDVIKELHGSCNLNSVHFLREIYKILTGSDFHEEGYSKFRYISVNERKRISDKSVNRSADSFFNKIVHKSYKVIFIFIGLIFGILFYLYLNCLNYREILRL